MYVYETEINQFAFEYVFQKKIFASKWYES